MKTLTVKLNENESANLETAMELTACATGAGCIRHLIVSFKYLMLKSIAQKAELKLLKHENEELKALVKFLDKK